ncbi:MAG: preprotein translocase subunit Sec61beta [Candidatus Ranarchaeia archaeon]
MAVKKKKSKSRKSGNAPMPAAGAGLIRFFQDETEGIKIGPTTVLILTAALITIVLLMHYFKPPV